ncbi:MAG: hypothetical protein IPI95_03510 [Flavobacteriales bacterium]|nr:hypothetical protein [Flavobacteriales bacterium]
MNALTFDIVQRTCAMYFAVRSRAIDESIGFGRDLDEVDVHWNKCPGGNMVACAKVPSANGDSTQMGIPCRIEGTCRSPHIATLFAHTKRFSARVRDW